MVSEDCLFIAFRAFHAAYLREMTASILTAREYYNAQGWLESKLREGYERKYDLRKGSSDLPGVILFISLSVRVCFGARVRVHVGARVRARVGARVRARLRAHF
jgi:hypothetical protein